MSTNRQSRRDPQDNQADPTTMQPAPAEQAVENSGMMAEIENLKDRLLRALAEQENIRRRAQREREEALRYAASDLAADMIPTADNLRRAIESVPPEKAINEGVRQILAGVEAIERGLLDAFQKHGITRIEPLGEMFDPNRHQAMLETNDDDNPPGTITAVSQPGYLYRDRLLRPAMVSVAKAPAATRQNDQRAEPTSTRSESGLETARVRTVAGVFQAREPLEAAIDDLFRTGVDRADIDIMAGVDAVRDMLGDTYVAEQETSNVPKLPGATYIARADAAGTLPLIAGILSFIGATAAAASVLASGGAAAVAIAAAAAGGAAGGGLGAKLARHLGHEKAEELEEKLTTGAIILWVRPRTPEREEKVQKILRDHGAENVRVHEIEIEKRLEDIPLSSLRPDPWLGSEPLGHPI